MNEIAVWSREQRDGVGDLVRRSSSVACVAQARLTPAFPVAQRTLAGGRARATNASQPDLHYLKTVLVTTGWNSNDDVFDRLEVWAARATPEDKPFNYEHDCADIIGHITSNCVLADDGTAVADAALADELPAKFHVVTGAVLYRYWEKESLQERMDRIVAEIGEGKWFVSMEALFNNFDYCLLDPKGAARVVARKDDTAFLTKHLRAYGGTGTFQGERVGRVLRNVVFSGKGLVRKPANPESLILSTATRTTADLAVARLQEQLAAKTTKQLALAGQVAEQLQKRLEEQELARQVQRAVARQKEEADAERRLERLREQVADFFAG